MVNPSGASCKLTRLRHYQLNPRQVERQRVEPNSADGSPPTKGPLIAAVHNSTDVHRRTRDDGSEARAMAPAETAPAPGLGAPSLLCHTVDRFTSESLSRCDAEVHAVRADLERRATGSEASVPQVDKRQCCSSSRFVTLDRYAACCANFVLVATRIRS
jgi:hypothetical protein